MFKDFYTFDAGYIIEDKLYFSSNFLNGLYVRDLNSNETRLIDCFPMEAINQHHLHKKCLAWESKLIFLPSLSAFIHIWDMQSHKFTTVKLTDSTPKDLYADGEIYDDKLYIFPVTMDNSSIVYDLKKDECISNTRFDEWCAQNIEAVNPSFVFTRVCKRENEILLPVYESNIIVHYNLDSGDVGVKKTEVEDLFFVTYNENNDDLWAVTNRGEYVYVLDDLYNVKCKYNYSILNGGNMGRRVNNIEFIENDIFILPAKEEQIYKLNRNVGIFEAIKTERELKIYNSEDVNFFRCGIYNGNLLVFPRNAACMLYVKDEKVDFINNNFDSDLYCANNPIHYQMFIKSIYNRDEICTESDIVTLQDFIDNMIV
ncbi:MAG: hypothetical protein ACI4EX_07005 [Lachnospiraceae bacterium]